MIYASDKLVQIDNPINPAIGLGTEAGRYALAKQLKADIDEYCAKAYDDDGPRHHLGASEIGHKCERYLWYKFRWCFNEKFNGRMQRLFNRGHREEERFIEWLTGVQCEVVQTDESGAQHRMVAVSGHFGGSCDGNAILHRYGLVGPVLLEFKTGSQEAHKKLAEGGVLHAKPMHWEQMCTYGVGFGIRYAVYISINKNDDDIHLEVLELDHEVGYSNFDKAARIVGSPEPPPRMSESPSFWECKFCAAHRICHMGEAIDRNCRSCKNATPADEGKWHCSKFGIIPKDFLINGCDNWLGVTE